MKYSLGGMHFHSKKDEAVQMEIYAHLIMFNAVARNVIAAGEWEAAQAEAAKQTAKTQKVPTQRNLPRNIHIISTLRWRVCPPAGSLDCTAMSR